MSDQNQEKAFSLLKEKIDQGWIISYFGKDGCQYLLQMRMVSPDEFEDGVTFSSRLGFSVEEAIINVVKSID